LSSLDRFPGTVSRGAGVAAERGFAVKTEVRNRSNLSGTRLCVFGSQVSFSNHRQLRQQISSWLPAWRQPIDLLAVDVSADSPSWSSLKNLF
jgi:hypothetical protein